MIMSMMNLPDDMFRLDLLPYLTVDDIVKLDNAYMNHEYRHQLMEKISGVILPGDKDEYMKASLFKWLGMRRIYLMSMNLLFEDDDYDNGDMENDYVNQFRYTHHVSFNGEYVTDDMAIFVISHCPSLLSMEMVLDDEVFFSHPQITYHTLQSIAEHCTGLESLSLRKCMYITDTGLINISGGCTGLQLLDVSWCFHLSDDSIISISTNCTGLKSLNLDGCLEITDTSIMSISTNCTGLKSLNLRGCRLITDASIISVSIHCTGLQSSSLGYCSLITDASIISISENCTGLKELNISDTNITDASLIAIATNCTELQLLFTYRCNELSDDELCNEFSSVIELRASLLLLSFEYIGDNVPYIGDNVDDDDDNDDDDDDDDD